VRNFVSGSPVSCHSLIASSVSFLRPDYLNALKGTGVSPVSSGSPKQSRDVKLLVKSTSRMSVAFKGLLKNFRPAAQFSSLFPNRTRPEYGGSECPLGQFIVKCFRSISLSVHGA